VQTILVANPKGGSGKTTLATNIAGMARRQAPARRSAGCDPQGSATTWLSRRPSLFPSIAGFAADAGKKEMKDVGVSGSSSTAPAGTRGEALRDAGAARGRDDRAGLARPCSTWRRPRTS
jgi:chromosome partitioning protein